MTEDEARDWLANRYPSPEIEKLAHFHDLLMAGTEQQNLIAPSTIPAIWARHFVDSAQLLDHAPANWSSWIDIGSGAGLPGIVIAILSGRPVTLIEPRRLRAAFLADCSASLGVATVVLQSKVENAEVPTADVITARAVAGLDILLSASRHVAHAGTTYLLPKGQSAHSEVAVAKRSWHGSFHVEQSIIDPNSGIVIATQVARR